MRVVGTKTCGPPPPPPLEPALVYVQTAVSALDRNAAPVSVLLGLTDRIDEAALLLVLSPQYYPFIPRTGEPAGDVCNGPYEPLAAALVLGAVQEGEVSVAAREHAQDVLARMPRAKFVRTAEVRWHRADLREAARRALDLLKISDEDLADLAVGQVSPKRAMETWGERLFLLFALKLVEAKTSALHATDKLNAIAALAGTQTWI